LLGDYSGLLSGGRMPPPPWLGSLGNFGTSKLGRTLLLLPWSIVLIPGGNLGVGSVGFSDPVVPALGCSVDGLSDFPSSL
jgi:hypothetical protein